METYSAKNTVMSENPARDVTQNRRTLGTVHHIMVTNVPVRCSAGVRTVMQHGARTGSFMSRHAVNAV